MPVNVYCKCCWDGRDTAYSGISKLVGNWCRKLSDPEALKKVRIVLAAAKTLVHNLTGVWRSPVSLYRYPFCSAEFGFTCLVQVGWCKLCCKMGQNNLRMTWFPSSISHVPFWPVCVHINNIYMYIFIYVWTSFYIKYLHTWAFTHVHTLAVVKMANCMTLHHISTSQNTEHTVFTSISQ